MQQKIFENARFLLVDDESSNLGVLEKMLSQWGALNITSTTNSRETFGLLAEFQPDIILLDLMMPVMDGFQVMEQLKPLLPEDEFLPILVLTADMNYEVKRRALDSGASDFLTKPFDAIELSLRIHNLLTRRFLHCRLQNQNHILDEKVQERTRQLAEAELDTVECLARAAEYRDDDTGRHAQRVGHTAAMLAGRLGLEEKRVQLIRRAAPLHDVGKIGIPDAILLKCGKLAPEEFAIMKTHAAIGWEIMSRHHTSLLQLAASIAHTHHERWDGTGYPQGLTNTAIPLEGLLVAVADVFDALTHERPYKEAWPVEAAVEEIHRQSGRQFAPDVVRVFLSLEHETLI